MVFHGERGCGSLVGSVSRVAVGKVVVGVDPSSASPSASQQEGKDPFSERSCFARFSPSPRQTSKTQHRRNFPSKWCFA